MFGPIIFGKSLPKKSNESSYISKSTKLKKFKKFISLTASNLTPISKCGNEKIFITNFSKSISIKNFRILSRCKNYRKIRNIWLIAKLIFSGKRSRLYHATFLLIKMWSKWSKFSSETEESRNRLPYPHITYFTLKMKSIDITPKTRTLSSNDFRIADSYRMSISGFWSRHFFICRER